MAGLLRPVDAQDNRKACDSLWCYVEYRVVDVAKKLPVFSHVFFTEKRMWQYCRESDPHQKPCSEQERMLRADSPVSWPFVHCQGLDTSRWDVPGAPHLWFSEKVLESLSATKSTTVFWAYSQLVHFAYYPNDHVRLRVLRGGHFPFALEGSSHQIFWSDLGAKHLCLQDERRRQTRQSWPENSCGHGQLCDSDVFTDIWCDENAPELADVQLHVDEYHTYTDAPWILGGYRFPLLCARLHDNSSHGFETGALQLAWRALRWRFPVWTAVLRQGITFSKLC